MFLPFKLEQCVDELMDSVFASQVTFRMLHLFRWSHAAELGKFISMSYVGGTFGTATTYPLGGFVLHLYGWEVRDILYSRS